MREILAIENYLFGKAAPQDKLLFEAQQIIDPTLQKKQADQQQAYQLVKMYGRKQLKAELQMLQNQLFTSPAHQTFADRIKRLFK